MTVAPSLRRVERLEDRTTPAITLPPGLEAVPLVNSGLSQPVTAVETPDGRYLVTEKMGDLEVVKNGAVLATPALTLAVEDDGERGLLGVALDPNFAANGFVYLYFTTTVGGLHNAVSRFTLVGDAIDPASEVRLIDLDPIVATNHNGGAIAFGPDGKLYVATGDNAVPSNAQSLTTTHGKMLRFNADGSIPADNPFFAEATGIHRAIWAYGLRNPYSFTFQPGTGRMFINDVGQNAFEEINEGGPGRNYGWPQAEGPSTLPNLSNPLLAYGHGDGPDQGAAIVGGAFYNPEGPPTLGAAYVGDYFYADFEAGWIRRFDPESGASFEFMTGTSLANGLFLNRAGELVYSQFAGPPGSTGFFRIRAVAAGAPTIVQQPTDATIGTGQSATLTVQAAGTAPLTYQWNRNGSPIPGATGASLVVTQSGSASGDIFTVDVTNAAGAVTSDPATLTILNNAPPVVGIVAPGVGTTFRAGTTVAFSGIATDAETGNLPASAYTWRVDYVTGGVVRPFVNPITGVRSGSFDIPTITPFTTTNVSYRIVLTATDPAGLTSETVREILPVTTTIRLVSNVGTAVALDGQPGAGGVIDVPAVVGLEREVSAAPTVTVDGKVYTFTGWSNGGPRVQRLLTPDAGLTLVASYALPMPVLAGTGAGPLAGVAFFGPDASQTRTVMPFPDLPTYTGGARVSAGDVTGDGVGDAVVATGAGVPSLVRVLDGVTLEATGKDIRPFEAAFRGGVFVLAADINRDGVTEILVSPDTGGGPRIRVMDADGNSVIPDFFGIDDPNFRGGARLAVSDLDADGFPELIVAAGLGGGPRVAVYDGAALAAGRVEKFVGDFFLFEPTLRNGVFLAGGDVSGDGAGDLIAGGGPGGGPRVFILSGASIAALGKADGAEVVGNFFAGPTSERGGVQMTLKDSNGDGVFGLVTGSGANGAIRVYDAATLDEASPTLIDQPAPLAGVSSIFVG